MKKSFLSVAFGLVSVLAVADEWADRPSHPAVVDPVCGYEPGTVIDLRGEWRFACNAYGADRSQFFRQRQFETTWKDERTITVPGCWEAQGVGKAVSAPGRVCCGGARGDFPLRHSFVGDGWYKRTVDIPADWAGKRIWLKVGGVGSQGWIWVNDEPVAHVFDFCATRKFEVTDLVTPGKSAKIVVEVTNAAASKLGTREGYGCWGGILRTIELEATPQVLMDDVWVRGDFDGCCAQVKVKVEGGGGQRSGSFSLRATVEDETVELPISSSTSTYDLHLALRAFRPWSPEHPNLYTAKVELVVGGKVVATRLERFGVRKLEVRGKEFYLNGKPFFMRGAGLHEINPIEGGHLADRAYWRTRIARIRAAGFNFVRLHTHCQSPEFFEVADELGLMVQAELPYYGDHPTLMGPIQPCADAEELYLNFRRHPSFAVYCGGNEGTFGQRLCERFSREIRARDSDRLVIEQDTGKPPKWKTDANFRKTDDFRTAKSRIWPRGNFDPPYPFVAHEYLNLAVKADTRLEDRFTGVWDRPFRRAVRGDWLKRFGLGLETGDRLQDAQHALQATWQKLGIESARTDPFCDGYFFWSLADCSFANEFGWTGQRDTVNPAHIAQGLFNPFWEEKEGGQTAAGFAVFNSPSGVFIDAKPAYLHLVSGEAFSFDVLFAHYGDAPLAEGTVDWRIVGADGAELAHGEKEVGRQELGGVRKVAAFAGAAPDVKKPVAARLAVSVRDGASVAAANSWPCWLFPRRTVRDGVDLAVTGRCAEAFWRAYSGTKGEGDVEKAGIVVADAGSPEIAAALARGQSVIEIGGVEGPENIQLGWWFLSGIVGASFDTTHPILSHLPESKVLSTLHFRIFKKGCRLPLGGFEPERTIALSEEGDGCYAHLVERVDAKGGRHLLVWGLALDQDFPEATAIIDGLVDFARRPVAEGERRTARADTVRTERTTSVGTKTESGGAGRD